MTRTRRFLGGFANGSVHMFAATVAGLWLTPFYLHHLGQDTFGLWLVGTQVIAYLLLMDFGNVALLPRETAYATGRAGLERPELRGLVERACTVAVAQMPFVLAAAGLVVLWLPPAWAPLGTPLAITLGLFIATFPMRVFQAVLTGLQDLAFVARTQFAAWLAGTLVNVGLVAGGFGLSALAAGWCLTQLIVVLACAVRVAIVAPHAMPRRLGFGSRAALRAYLARSGWVSVSQISQVLLNGTDMIIVGAVLGPAAVVPYACTGKLIAVLANQPQAILQSAAPALCELRASADRARLFQVSAALAQATLAVSGLVACIVLAVNAGFVAWWVGAGQFGGAGLTVLLLTAMVVRHFNTTNVYALFCFGMERRLALTGLADGAVTVALSLVLVKLLGAAGAPLGAIAGVLLVSVPLNVSVLSRETGVGSLRLVGILGPWLLRFLAVAVTAGLAGVWLPASTLPSLALAGAVTLLAYLGAVVPAVLRSPAGMYLRPLLERAMAGVRCLPRARGRLVRRADPGVGLSAER